MPAPARYEIELKLAGTAFHNRYPIWLYPDSVDTTAPPGVTVARSFDDNIRRKLDGGGSVVLIPELRDSDQTSPVLFMTDFWCYPMFKRITDSTKRQPSPGTMGLLIDPAHPALREFPTAVHTDWQWWHLVKNSRAFVLDGTPLEYKPEVQVIDNVFRNHKLGLVFETRVGKGKLLVCGVDLPGLSARPEARQLMRSLLSYAASGDFHPPAELSPRLLAEVLSGGPR